MATSPPEVVLIVRVCRPSVSARVTSSVLRGRESLQELYEAAESGRSPLMLLTLRIACRSLIVDVASDAGCADPPITTAGFDTRLPSFDRSLPLCGSALETPGISMRARPFCMSFQMSSVAGSAERLDLTVI